MSLSKVIELARADLGYTENPPGSNRVKYWDAYDPKMQGQPWCVAALWYWFNEAGERMAFFGGGKTASCSMLLRWYKEQGLTVDVTDIRVGDIVILNFSETKETQHCGLVTEVNRWYETKQLIQIQTIEGNTSPSDGSQSNGGMVCEKTRYPSQIVGVCRPQYKPDDPQPVDDWSNHHAADAIRWGKEIGLIQGYPDGSVRPDEPMPMWRMLTILKRYDDYRFGGGGR